MKNELGTTLFLVSLFLILASLPIAQASTSYVQPLNGVSWGHTVLVSIPTSPDWANAAIVESLYDWNQAQQWFVQSWFPNHPNALFTLKESTTTADITIQYVANTGQPWAGFTNVRSISIVLSRFHDTYPTALTALANHELGHALGLDHTTIANDLMNPKYSYSAQNPSTLNLYAVYLEANGGTFQYGDTVTLPSAIPFMTWYPGTLPMPEYPNPTLLFEAAVLPLILAVLRRFNASS